MGPLSLFLSAAPPSSLPQILKSTNAATLAARLAACSDHDTAVTEQFAQVKRARPERRRTALAQPFGRAASQSHPRAV